MTAVRSIVARNVNSALEDALWWLKVAGIKESSRNGPVLVAPTPVAITYTAPLERVLFSPARDANPYFHFFEALWMLAGRDDLEWVLQFNKRFASFSDDGQSVHGAYGYRWRQWFGFDQLRILINHLRDQPDTRRAVLSMWSPVGDLTPTMERLLGGLASKDVPCNCTAFFDRRGGRLNMTMCNRSNDLLWGCCGANAVHFAFLLEYMAAAVGCPAGQYIQFSNNLHAYLELLGYPSTDPLTIGNHDYYTERGLKPQPLVQDSAAFDTDLKDFLAAPLRSGNYREPFFARTAAPMYASWHARKSGSGTGLTEAAQIAAEDWRVACTEWIERREAAPRRIVPLVGLL